MLPKDLTPQVIEKLKETARAYPAGSIPAGFDPNNFVFHSHTGLTVMLTLDSYENEPYWHMSMSYARRPPRDEEVQELLSAFFGATGEEARRVLTPEGSNPNVLHYRVTAP